MFICLDYLIIFNLLLWSSTSRAAEMWTVRKLEKEIIDVLEM